VINDKQSVISDNADEIKNIFRSLGWKKECRSILLIPVMGREELLGVLNVNRTLKQESFNEYDLEKANLFTSLVSLSVMNIQLFDKLIQAQGHLVYNTKLVTIGQLAACVAHELNNPLTGILGNVQLLLAEHKWDELKDIESSSMKMAKIISRFLEFTRLKDNDMEPVEIHPVLDGVFSIMESMLKIKKIELTKDFREPLTVHGSKIYLEQVFINIISNAIKAMPHGGELRVVTGETGNRKDQAGVLIEFKDTGIGIEKEKLKIIREPFFTLDKLGGTGVGLSISQDIICKHGGELYVSSQGKNKGTTVKILLPVQDKIKGPAREKIS
ncbi:MAG: HAMP domain-containing sensor histidine kinase, partial [bacterium]|nr:HAMP domain-containing sensor histidine kinase [bacterium]